MIAVIRIKGRVELKTAAVETFQRLRLKRKLHCILIDEKDKIRMGMLNSLKNYVVFGEVDEKLIEEMKKKRKDENGVFRLHPPIGGFKKSTKLTYPKGVLGNNKDIAKLIKRML
jgi:ribosomal protein L30/L7E